jgi:hypothetical protein
MTRKMKTLQNVKKCLSSVFLGIMSIFVLILKLNVIAWLEKC